MKQKMSIAGILLLAALGMQANNYTVKSPDGKLVVNVACEGGKASYTVDYNGKQMLGTSALGLVANYGDFSKNLTMGILKGGEVKPLAYKMTRIKKSDIQKDVVDATIGFLNSKKDSMTLHLHVSNNDIAYKYEMIRPKKDNPKSVIIYNEVSGFNFPEDHHLPLSSDYSDDRLGAHQAILRGGIHSGCSDEREVAVWCGLYLSMSLQGGQRRMGIGQRNRCVERLSRLPSF